MPGTRPDPVRSRDRGELGEQVRLRPHLGELAAARGAPLEVLTLCRVRDLVHEARQGFRVQVPF
jgi:hypothetical protein